MFAIAIYSDAEVQLCDLQGTEEDKDNQPMILVEACTENSGKSYRAILDLLDENEEARDDFGKLIARIVQEVQKYERERLGRKIVNLLD